MATKKRDRDWAPSTPFECVEIYIPKTLENLAKLYGFLQSKLIERQSEADALDAIDGFSLYEVDGAFSGQEIYQERPSSFAFCSNGTRRKPPDRLRKKSNYWAAKWPQVSP